MSDIAIRAENLSKKFFLGERIGFKTFRETLQDAVVSPIRRIISGKASGATVEEKVDTDRQIWALKDVSFEVKHGEVLGIIGPNGAGKSTLLKILSRITEPTGGYAEIRGRVGSLLEVGTGFHPELTGRENVYLNGAILGMSRAEIRRKFDDIVSFAGVEKFIDTPVKRYSSGMQVRLAFAVAAHLDPEILIIDEVLAVGDAEFQKRCLGKMNEVSRSGRTVLFVSHNMAAVEALCTRAILLERGELAMIGPLDSILEVYLPATLSSARSYVDLRNHPNRQRGTARALLALRILTMHGDQPCIRVGDDIRLDLEFYQREGKEADTVVFAINSVRGVRICTCNSRFQSKIHIPRDGRVTAACLIRNLRLTPGMYFIDVLLKSSGATLDSIPNAGAFRVLSVDVYGTGRVPSAEKGFLQPIVEWSVTTE